MTDEPQIFEVTIVGYGSRHVLLLPWRLGVLLEWALPGWAADDYVS